MSTINYSEKYTINLPTRYVKGLKSIISPDFYSRFWFYENKKSNSYDKNKSDRLNMQDELNLLRREREEAINRSKNLLALSLIYKTFVSTKHTQELITLELNTMLAYELYASLSAEINKNKASIVKTEEQINKQSYQDDHNLLQENIKSWKEENEVYRELVDCVIKVFRPEIVFELINHYPTLSINQHSERCYL